MYQLYRMYHLFDSVGIINKKTNKKTNNKTDSKDRPTDFIKIIIPQSIYSDYYNSANYRANNPHIAQQYFRTENKDDDFWSTVYRDGYQKHYVEHFEEAMWGVDGNIEYIHGQQVGLPLVGKKTNKIGITKLNEYVEQINNYISQINNESLAYEIEKIIDDSIKICTDEISKIILEYFLIRVRRIYLCDYEIIQGQKLLSKFLASYFIYILTHKISYFEISPDFRYGIQTNTLTINKYFRYRRDKYEIDNIFQRSQVLISDQAMATIYNLAERANPNICAKYEVANMAYYGKGLEPISDKERAYELYHDIVSDDDIYFPLPRWDIASWWFDFDEKLYESQYPKVYQKITLLKHNGIEPFYKKILEYCLDGVAFNDARSMNLLGRIIGASDDVFPAQYKNKFEYDESKKYYEKAADNGYMFGYSNIAAYYAQKKKNKEAINNLYKAAQLGQPYSLFKCAQLCILGKTIIRGNIVYDDSETKDYSRGLVYLNKAIKYSVNYTENYAPYLFYVKEFFEVNDDWYLVPKTNFITQDVSIDKVKEYLLKAKLLVEQRSKRSFRMVKDVEDSDLVLYVNPAKARNVIENYEKTVKNLQ